MNTANDGINSSQALGGNLFSSDTANKLAAQNQVIASNMYNNALNAYNSDRSAEQAIWAGNEQAKQAQVNSQMDLAGRKYDMAQATADKLYSGQNDYLKQLMGVTDNYYQDQADYLSELAKLQAQDPGKVSTLSWLTGGIL